MCPRRGGTAFTWDLWSIYSQPLTQAGLWWSPCGRTAGYVLTLVLLGGDLYRIVRTELILPQEGPSSPSSVIKLLNCRL